MAASIMGDHDAAIPDGEGCGWGAAALGACRGLQRQGTLDGNLAISIYCSVVIYRRSNSGLEDNL